MAYATTKRHPPRRGRAAAFLLASALSLAFITRAIAEDSPRDSTDSSVQVERAGVAFQIAIDDPNAQQRRGVAVLLHGFPGNPLGKDGWRRQDLLVASLVNEGYSVVRFDYIGSWGNQGQFTWLGGVQDAEAVIRYLRSPEARSRGIAGSRIVLVGHSYGGWVALMTAARDEHIRCVAVMASANMGRTGQLIRDDHGAYERRVALYEEALHGPDAPIRAEGAEDLAKDLIAQAENLDLTTYAKKLSSKKLFLVSAGNDQIVPQQLFTQPLIDRLREAGAPLRTAVVDGAGHNFPEHGTQVNDMLYRWIAAECGT